MNEIFYFFGYSVIFCTVARKTFSYENKQDNLDKQGTSVHSTAFMCGAWHMQGTLHYECE